MTHWSLFDSACVTDGNIYWTYHVNMRLRSRKIGRKAIVDSLEKYEVASVVGFGIPCHSVFAAQIGAFWRNNRVYL